MRMLDSFSCFCSAAVRDCFGSPCICSRVLRTRGPGCFSRKGLNVSQGVASHRASNLPASMSVRMLSHVGSLSKSQGLGATMSMAHTLHPREHSWCCKSPSRLLPANMISAHGLIAFGPVLQHQYPYIRGGWSSTTMVDVVALDVAARTGSACFPSGGASCSDFRL